MTTELTPGQERREIDVRLTYINEDPTGKATNLVPAIETAVRQTCAAEGLSPEVFTITVNTKYGPRAVG